MKNQRHIIWPVVNVETGEIQSLNGLISSESDSFEIKNVRTGEVYKIYADSRVVRAEELEDWE